MSYLKRAWHGEAELWTVFWLGWLWPLLFYVIVIMLAVGAGLARRYAPPHYVPEPAQMKLGVLSIFLAISLWYALWQPISIWRCARNCEHAIWTYLACIHAALMIFTALVTTVLLGLVIFTVGFANLPAFFEAGNYRHAIAEMRDKI